MGMYTKFHFECRLKKDTPDNVIKALTFMTDPDIIKYGEIGDMIKNTLPDVPLFSDKTRWQTMLISSSCYFNSITHSVIEEYYEGSWLLSINCNFKNYSNEIEQFVEWLMPYIHCYSQNDDYLGYYRYEEDRSPTPIYFRGKYMER